MKITVTGATGMIGRAVVSALTERGDEVTVLTRDTDRARSVLGDVEAISWENPMAAPAPPEALAGRDGIIHLLGESLAQRWTDDAKRAIRESRVRGTRHLVAALHRAHPEPRVLISQSATGFYGPRGDEPVDEHHSPGRPEFLSSVCREWEAEAERAEDLGVRVVMMRTGLVLSSTGGALKQMRGPFKLGLGGPVAGGRQYVPWVHLDDVVGAFLFCLEAGEAKHQMNVTAPEPVTNKQFAKALGHALRRPALVRIPAFALRLRYGEMASVVTTGARAVPKRLQELGYSFKYPELEPALRAALGKDD